MENIVNLSNYRTKKSYILAYIIWLFSGFGGLHMFYVGKKTLGKIKLAIFIGSLTYLTGISPLLTLALALIIINTFWTLFDIFMVPFWVRKNNRTISAIKQEKKFKFFKVLGFVFLILIVSYFTNYQLYYVINSFKSAHTQISEKVQELNQQSNQ